MDELELIIPEPVEVIIENETNKKKIRSKIKFQLDLINLVRKNRILYDTKCTKFSQYGKHKEEVWNLIAMKLKNNVDDCKSAWAKLRYDYQHYVRRLRKFLSVKNNKFKCRPTMAFETEMMFLYRYVTDRKYSGPLPYEEADKIAENKEEDDDLIILEDQLEVIDLDDDETDCKKAAIKVTDHLKITKDVWKLVELIRAYPELYNTEHHYFADYKRKGIIWNAIANEMNDKATKLMKMWIYIQTRYEWELMRKKDKKRTSRESVAEFETLMEFVKPYILSNPDTVCKQSFYLKKAWHEPLDQFKTIFSLLSVMRRITNLIPLTEDLLNRSGKSQQYFSLWGDVAKIRNTTPGQCETTWLMLRYFYWELMKMRKQSYQLQDKWYFETTLTELYALCDSSNQKKPTRRTTPKKPIEAENVSANVGEEQIGQNLVGASHMAIPVVTNVSVGTNAPSTVNANKNSTNSNVVMMQPIAAIASDSPPVVNSPPINNATNDANNYRRQMIDTPIITHAKRNPSDVIKMPIITSATSLAPFLSNASVNNNANNKTGMEADLTSRLLPKTTEGLPQKAIVAPPAPVLQQVIRMNAPSTAPPLARSPELNVALAQVQPQAQTQLQAQALVKAQIQARARAQARIQAQVPASTQVHIHSQTSQPLSVAVPIEKTAASPLAEQQSPNVCSVELPFTLPKHTSVTAVPNRGSPQPLITYTRNSPPALVPMIPAKPQKAGVKIPRKILPKISTPPQSQQPPTPPQSQQPQPPPPPPQQSQPQPPPQPKSASNTGSALNRNEIMIELVSTATGNQLVIHGPVLPHRYSLNMATTAKLIREILAIPQIHHKELFSDNYWEHIAKVFNLPSHICKGCWNFLADNFNHFPKIAPMDELMKPFHSQLPVWSIKYDLFQAFDSSAVKLGWLRYQSQLPHMIQEISKYPSLYSSLPKHGKLGELASHRQMNEDWRAVLNAFSSIGMYTLRQIWNSIRNVFWVYMNELERGIDNKWPQNWWRSLDKMKFLMEYRYHDKEPFYYIVRNKMIEELNRCQGIERKLEEDAKKKQQAKLIRPVAVMNILEKSKVRRFDAYALILAIRRHPNTYRNCGMDKKREAWAKVANEMNTSVRDCQLVFQRAIKKYRLYVRMDGSSRCTINKKYFKHLNDIYREVKSQMQISVKNATELNIGNKTEENAMVLPEKFIPDINMDNSKPALVMKNWAYAMSSLPASAQEGLEHKIRTLFNQYKNQHLIG